MIGTLGLRENEIFGMYVAWNRIRKGIGSELMNHASAYCRKKGMKSIRLISIPRANGFYLEHGFKQKRKRIVTYGENPFEQIYLEKMFN